MTREELLVILIEECGEVIQAATKCLRFGWDRDFPQYGNNGRILAKEVGELTAIMDALPLDAPSKEWGRAEKIQRAMKAKTELERAFQNQNEERSDEVSPHDEKPA